MEEISLRKLKKSDECYFSKWWRDKDLIALTSGNFDPISDKQIGTYFQSILNKEKSFHFMINMDKEAIGHISLSKRRGYWHEMQIIIGEKGFWNKGYGQKAIKLMIKKADQLSISKIYLKVRPDNSRAIKAYENSGFVIKKTKQHSKNNDLFGTVRMELARG